MKYSLLYEIKIQISLTVADLDQLVELARDHYSSDCRCTVMPDGFITKLRSDIWEIMHDANRALDCILTTHQLDLICKICEADFGLFVRYQTILVKANERSRELNQGY